ncbi:double zinc ribbon domain-containing protein [Neogemmobacter tilapiae]|uniref:Amidophosphoribosyltransferase n=1 Tax=Neogemmobacter tilapiae TaxID=875041 RepID=A0A918TJF0_9RHOB|nr:double zinc ribbon domain-containing protein [Gemmobacter tilapiae]GHC50478.1 amidophosphoribosyltransferase [Gemmobacter tilapiae]
MAMQAALKPLIRAIYPPQCLTCDTLVTTEFGLCADCWRETPFIRGLVCDQCGVPLAGDEDGQVVQCDDCLAVARPWGQGRAALLYQGNGRKLVLGLKHGDRLDLARPASDWLLRAAGPMLRADMLVAPIPLHWLRLIKRRYNQAGLLSAGVARLAGLEHCPDLLLRKRFTGSQDGKTREGRFRNMEGALRLHPRRAGRVEGRHVLLVDDVMTSGATFAAAAEACLAEGASGISVLALARVAKES